MNKTETTQLSPVALEIQAFFSGLKEQGLATHELLDEMKTLGWVVNLPTKIIGLSPRRKRKHISSSVQRFVWQRDRGKCVNCHSNELLEYDHIVPLSRGGSNRARNLQLLCKRCNSRKNNRIGGERRNRGRN